MHRLVPTVVASVLAAMAAGCGSDDGEASTSNGFADGYSVTAALAELPYAEPRGRTQVIVMTGDLEKATALAGVERPDLDDPRQVGEWLRALNGDVTLPAAESVGLNSVNQRSSGTTLGYTAADVRFFTELRDSLDRFSVQTLHEDAEVSEDLPTTDGLRTTGEGEPGSLNKDPASFAQFPMVNVLATKGDQVAFSTEASQIEDSRAGTGRRLLRDEKLADLAEVLDRRSVYGAYLVEGSFDQFRGHPPDDAIDQTFDAVAIGLDLDDEVPVVHVAYWFEQDAEAAVDQVEQAWKGLSRRTNRPLSDYVEVRGSDRAGHVVTVELVASAAGPGVVLQMLSAADTPFQGE